MPNLAVMYNVTFPTKPRLHESGQIGQKLNVPINMSGHSYNKKTKAKNKKETNYTIYGTAYNRIFVWTGQQRAKLYIFCFIKYGSFVSLKLVVFWSNANVII